MVPVIIAPESLRQHWLETKYFAELSKAAQWVLQGRTPLAFADLPTNPSEGDQIPITDSNTAVFHAVIGGGGGNHVLGYFDGTNWRVGG